MKWKNLNERELEITFDSGTKVLAFDKKPVAAMVILPDGSEKVLQSSKITDPADKQLINVWFGSQPKTIKLVDPLTFDVLIAREHRR